MQTDHSKFKTRIGRVNIEPFREKIRLRWSYQKKRYSLTIGDLHLPNFKNAIAQAQIIDTDISLGCFDTTLSRYKTSSNQNPSLNEIWERYTNEKSSQVSHNYRQNKWNVFSRLLNKISKTYYPTEKDIQKLFQEAQNYYSEGTLIPLTVALSACLNWASKQGYEVANPCSSIRSELKKGEVKQAPQCFSSDEISSIIDAFNENRFVCDQSRYLHSYYAPYVCFLALTGFRPEEAIALRWDDIHIKNFKRWIRVEKAFTNGKLNPRTKTGEVRDFPVNLQLSKLLDRIPRRDEVLIFPSVKGGYIDQRNFTRRYWQPVVQALVKEGSVSQYLSPYHLRHTFITNLIRQGCDLATVGKLVGNKPQTILNSYLSAMVHVEIPEFDF